MPLQTIQLTLLQQVQLIIAIEEQIKNLTRRVSNPGADPSTSAFLEDYQNLLRLVADVVAVQVEPPAPEATPCAA